MSVTASCCVGGAAVNVSVMVHGSMSMLYLHHKGIFVSLKNPTIGQGTWKLDARYGELI